MSTELSAESIFIARNWETVAEIVQATKQLRGEMDRLLAGLKDDLQERAWWDENWTFLVRRSGAVCIARQTWKSSEDYLVRICIDRFTPESVFGLDDPPYLYVYVPGRRQDVYASLMEAIGERLVLGDIDRRGSSFILVQQAVNKCLPDMVEQYLPKAQSQILTFFDYYASLAHGWDPVLKQFLTAAQGE